MPKKTPTQDAGEIAFQHISQGNAYLGFILMQSHGDNVSEALERIKAENKTAKARIEALERYILGVMKLINNDAQAVPYDAPRKAREARNKKNGPRDAVIISRALDILRKPRRGWTKNALAVELFEDENLWNELGIKRLTIDRITDIIAQMLVEPERTD